MLSKRLSTEDVPSGSDSSVGDFVYYPPLGNIKRDITVKIENFN